MYAATGINIVLAERLILEVQHLSAQRSRAKFTSALMNQQRRRDEYYSRAQWLMNAVLSQIPTEREKTPWKTTLSLLSALSLHSQVAHLASRASQPPVPGSLTRQAAARCFLTALGGVNSPPGLMKRSSSHWLAADQNQLCLITDLKGRGGGSVGQEKRSDVKGVWGGHMHSKFISL